MKKTAVIIMFITIFSKIFGFLRDIVLSYFYGASSISDVYLVALAVPTLIFSFIGTGIATGYIPMFSKIVQGEGAEEGNKYTNNLINTILAICTVLIILGLMFTSQIVKVFASGFTGETLRLAVKFTRISLIGMYFSGIMYVFTGYLQIKGSYYIPALIGFPLNFFTILSIYLSYKTDIMVLAVGSVIAIAFQLILLVPFVYKKGYKYRFIFNIRNEYIIKMAYIALPVIIGVSVDQINTIVDKTIASGIAVGGISALNYASKLNWFIQGLFVTSLSTVMYPIISKMAAERDMVGLKKSVAEAVSSVSLLIIPAAFGFMIFAEPITTLLFGRGAFDAAAIEMTSTALFFYSIGMIGVGLREIISKAFYSLQDTKTPMINATIAMFLNIILNLILSRYMGIGGLALATSISALFCTGLLIISFRKKVGPLGLKSLSITALKILFASSIMSILAKTVFTYLTLKLSEESSLLLGIGIGVVIYFIGIYFMRIKEVEDFIDTIRRRYS